MAEKIATIEELLGDTITEVTLYRTPSGSLFKTKEEASHPNCSLKAAAVAAQLRRATMPRLPEITFVEVPLLGRVNAGIS